jgi:hypothetical protein
MSALGVERSFIISPPMSADDPRRTPLALRRASPGQAFVDPAELGRESIEGPKLPRHRHRSTL